MNILSLLSVSAPKSLWITLIEWIQSAVGNLGWTIILVTVFIKIVTTPLDFWVKLSTKKQTLIQQKCAPQVAKLQKKFGADRNTLNVQTQSLYKREGLDSRTGCIVMLINTILSFTIFITFYNDLRKYSAYEAINQYEQVEQAYTNSSNQAFIDFDPNDEFKTVQDINDWFDSYNAITDDALKEAEYNAKKEILEYATEKGSKAAIDTWEKISEKSSWLWVQNIWVADGSDRIFPSYNALVSIAKDTGYTGYVKDKDKINPDTYNRIATLVADSEPRQNNGYYVLPILAGLITFLSQYIAELHNKLKNKKANTMAKTAAADMGSTMKVMKIVMPVIMVIFTLTASASFGLYILASNIASMAFGELIALSVNQLTKKTQREVEEALEKEANKLIKKGKLKG